MKTLLRAVLVWIPIALTAAKACAGNVAVILSSDASLYQEALEGFREVVRNGIVSVQTLKENSAGWRDELKKLRSTIEPDLIFVVGTSALQAVSSEITNIPIVHTMVFNPGSVVSPTSKNVFGISMNPTPNQVLALVKELNPKYRRVGVIFDPSRSAPQISQARSIAQKEGLDLVARDIRSARDIAAALNSLERQIDFLWLWPDEMYLTDDILQRIFLFSFDRKIPVLGLSERHTQMGALLSLSYASAKDSGRQAAEAVNRFLGGVQETAFSQISLRQTKLTVNLKTARKLALDVPDSIVRRADNGVKAPAYEEGDWWVFRTKRDYSNGTIRAEDHRVIFKNGKFESDNPAFLTGSPSAGTPSFLPFASVYLTDPRRKWLDFPLLAGRKWSFRYSRRAGVSRASSSLSGHADVDVIGRTAEPVKTPAGTFEAIEISRTDTLNGVGHLTYFYSTETKSVVKLYAETATGKWGPTVRHRFELELIAYGAAASESKPPR